MITTLKKWEIRNKETGELLTEGSLKLNGYTYELHTQKEIIMRGIDAERHYKDFVESNKELCNKLLGDRFEFKEVI